MKINYDDISGLGVSDLKEEIYSHERMRLSELTLFDLILDGAKANRYVHGVYFFFDPRIDQLLYVGKVQSPQFIERLPAHLAIGEGSWSNQFLKSHRKRIGVESLESAAIDAKECELLLLLAPPDFSNKIEALLIWALKPIYNRTRPKAGIDFNAIEGLVIEKIVEPNKRSRK